MRLRGTRCGDAVPAARSRMDHVTLLASLQFFLALSPAVKAFHVGTSSPAQFWRARVRGNAASRTRLSLFRGIARSVEREYQAEEEDALETLKDALEKSKESSDLLGELRRYSNKAKRRMPGDAENKFQLIEPRSYANSEVLDRDHTNEPPTLNDLNQKPIALKDSYWVLPPFRLLVLGGAYLIFPWFTKLWSIVETVGSEDFGMVAGQFGPGVGVLYGTIVALTLDILYERQSRVQENATLEAGLLSQITQNLLSVFDGDDEGERELAKESCQLVADQVRILIKRTRGAELLAIMRADPYSQLLGLIDNYHRERGDTLKPQEQSVVQCLREDIPQIMEARAKRLSDEASSLPPTHFLVLSLLTVLILVGYTVSTLTITDEMGNPPQESSLVFAALTAVYVLFFNFCKDLNGPFRGVYQIRRSSAASYLIQIKWLISNQPFASEIKFDEENPAIYKNDGEVESVGTASEALEDPATNMEEMYAVSTTVQGVPTINGSSGSVDLVLPSANSLKNKIANEKSSMSDLQMTRNESSAVGANLEAENEGEQFLARSENLAPASPASLSEMEEPEVPAVETSPSNTTSSLESEKNEENAPSSKETGHIVVESRNATPLVTPDLNSSTIAEEFGNSTEVEGEVHTEDSMEKDNSQISPDSIIQSAAATTGATDEIIGVVASSETIAPIQGQDGSRGRYFMAISGFGGGVTRGEAKAATDAVKAREVEARLAHEEKVRLLENQWAADPMRKEGATKTIPVVIEDEDPIAEINMEDDEENHVDEWIDDEAESIFGNDGKVEMKPEEGTGEQAMEDELAGMEALTRSEAEMDQQQDTREEDDGVMVVGESSGRAVEGIDTKYHAGEVKATPGAEAVEKELAEKAASRAAAEVEKKRQAEEEAAKAAAEEEAEAEAKRKAEEEATRAAAEADAEAKRQADEKAAMAAAEVEAEAEAEAKRQSKEEAATAALEAEAEANRQAEEEAARAAAEAKQQAKEEAARAEAEAKMRAEEDARIKPLKDRATGIEFAPKISDDLYLLGVGVRKKAIINVYSVAAYSSLNVKKSLSLLSAKADRKRALPALRSAVRSCPTTFCLQMAFKAGAETMASAIAESVAPRHEGGKSEVDQLKKLIFDGVKAKGAATKGTKFQFDCTTDEVVVSVDGNIQGSVSSSKLSESFCDVYFDDKAVSPNLRDSCLQNCCTG